MAKEGFYRIWIQNQLIEVTEEVYLTYYRMERRARFLEEQDYRHGCVSYHALDKEGMSGEELLRDAESTSVEEEVFKKIIVEELYQALALLTDEEWELIKAIYYLEMSEREYAGILGISQNTVHKRKHGILKKLKKRLK